jgi:hypothetical protein
MRLNEHQNPMHAENPVPTSKEELIDSGIVETDDPLDLGYEQGNIVAYEDDLSFNMTVLSTGWEVTELD